MQNTANSHNMRQIFFRSLQSCHETPLPSFQSSKCSFLLQLFRVQFKSSFPLPCPETKLHKPGNPQVRWISQSSIPPLMSIVVLGVNIPFFIAENRHEFLKILATQTFPAYPTLINLPWWSTRPCITISVIHQALVGGKETRGFHQWSLYWEPQAFQTINNLLLTVKFYDLEH